MPDEAITVNSAAFITKPSKKDQDILLKDVSGTSITPVSLSGNTITILDVVKDVFIKGIFKATETQMQSLTIDSDNAGTFTTLTQDGSSGTITFEINSTPATLPFTLSASDVLDVFRTTGTSLGNYKISGTYV